MRLSTDAVSVAQHGTFMVTRLPSGFFATMSVNVPPRSIQNSHRPSSAGSTGMVEWILSLEELSKNSPLYTENPAVFYHPFFLYRGDSIQTISTCSR